MKLDNSKQLRSIYGYPKGRTVDKVLTSLEKHSAHFIAISPFVVMSTFDNNHQLDTSPRGGAPGFVRVIDSTQIIIPDTKGNNRIDSMINILETGRISLLFLIPGVDETLRVGGSAEIIDDTGIMEIFKKEKNPPKTCIKVNIDEVFLQCAKALMRSKLWSQDAQIERKSFPTIGQMINDQLSLSGEIESNEDMIARYQADL